jgi:pyruvate dehydrogenase E1 component
MAADYENGNDRASIEETETREWLESLDYVIERGGPQRVGSLLRELEAHAHKEGVRLPFSRNTPYINSIPLEEQPPYPGSREIERRIKSVIRWNAMAMVVRANRLQGGIGGHISTYASVAALYEVGFNHFFRAPSESFSGDQVYFQGHASPGNYARAYLEGRLSVEQLESFRREVPPAGGLPSYPHPRLMPEFWQFPTVSMGLGPIMAIYQARFNRYLEDRGLKKPGGEKVWCFLGDGETDEPEALGAITLASRARLDNLIFVVNCNLQRLDGPVRGNGKIIQELEAAFRGAGWNVIKVIWGEDWDDLLAADHSGHLVRRMGEVVDGEYQNYIVKGGDYIRKHFFGKHPELEAMVEKMTDEQLHKLRTGGHDPAKIHAAFRAAVEHEGEPTVILARTVKGYGLGEAGEGKNITHQQKKLNEQELRQFRSRFGIPISDEEVDHLPFYRPADDSPEMRYLHERREALGGYLPARRAKSEPLPEPPEEIFREFHEGTGERRVATTMVFVRILSKLLRDETLGRLVVPIVPDEARTFGMEPLFRQVGIYSHVGQLYEPVDRENLLYYKEAVDGQILEEGITEAGSMSSFIAAGTAYSTHGVNTIPFFLFYSIFGFQRIGDLIWAAGDMMARGFLVGGTSGRTTLAGEGLQHQDGQSHLFAYAYPTLRAYDPAFAYELAVIVRDGIRRMYTDREDCFYYLTVMNESYAQPPMPEGSEEGIIRGIYRFRGPDIDRAGPHANLLGSGSILNQAIGAKRILEEDHGVATTVWSVTSYSELHRDALDAERHDRLHPEEETREPFVAGALKEAEGVFVAASDYVRAVPESIARWIPGRFVSLGTDGYGRSDIRADLRRHFEVDARHIALAALHALALEGEIERSGVARALRDLEIDPDKMNPRTG